MPFASMSAPLSSSLSMTSSQPSNAAKWRGAVSSCGGAEEWRRWKGEGRRQERSIERGGLQMIETLSFTI